jgi:hypothetical protein
MPPPARRRSRTETRLTADLDVPGAFEGETITRRRLVTGGANVAGAVAAAAIVVPALGFALGPLGMRAKATWQAIGPPDAFSEQTFVARIITFAPELGSLGKTTVFVRQRNRRLDTEPGDRWTSSSSSPRAARTSAAQSVSTTPPGRSSARATAASTTSAAAAPAARPPGRSTASTRGCAAGWSKSVRATASIALCTASAPATRASRWTASASTSTPRARRRRPRPTDAQRARRHPVPFHERLAVDPVADSVHGAMHAVGASAAILVVRRRWRPVRQTQGWRRRGSRRLPNPAYACRNRSWHTRRRLVRPSLARDAVGTRGMGAAECAVVSNGVSNRPGIPDG